MAKISRKFSDYKTNIGELQTTQIWVIEITDANKAKGATNFKFKTSEISGCPPSPDVNIIDVPTGGFTMRFFGKIDKHGSMGFDVFEDTNGTAGKFYREVMRSYMGSTSDMKKPDGVVQESTDLSADLRFKIKVTLAKTDGTATKTWRFFNALCKPTQEASLNQEAGAYKYKFDFEYEMYLEGNGDEGDVW